MKLRLLALMLLTTILSTGLCTKVSAQHWYGHGSRRSYTVYAPDTAFENSYSNDYYNWRYHPRKYYKHKYWAARRYHDHYYYDRYDRYDRRYYRRTDRRDHDGYYYRGGGY